MTSTLILNQEELHDSYQTGDTTLAIFKPRRGDGWQIKPWAESNDGKTFSVIFSGIIGDGIYKDEQRWMLSPGGIAHDAPVWLASGDLWFQGLARKG